MSHSEQEVMGKMGRLMDSSGEVVAAYADLAISKLHEQLETVTDYKDIRFIQGQIAGIRDFCSVVKD